MRKSLFPFVCVFVMVSGVSVTLRAKTIHVPADQSTIQAAIDVSSNGDTILVSPGTYTENIDFKGKAITVSALNPGMATIDGGAKGPVVTFAHQETKSAVLQGFVIQNGYNTFDGGGISINYASPTIQDNTITKNIASGGAGIYAGFSSALILNNSIVANSDLGAGTFGVVYIGGAGTVQFIGNLVANNTLTGSDFGAGMTLFGAGTPLIENNVIQNNCCTGEGGGIAFVNESPATVVQNLITGNGAQQGGGIALSIPNDNEGPTLVNNTVVGNTASYQGQGSAVYVSGFPSYTTLYNNIFATSDNETAVYCDNTYGNYSPQFHHNLAYSSQGTSVYGPCTTGFPGDGNLELDPDLNSKFRVLGKSPVINQGDRQAPSLPALDLFGNPRLGYHTSGPGSLEMGAYAYVPVAFATPSLVFDPTELGSKRTLPLPVHNYSQQPVTVQNFQITGDFSQTNNCSQLPVDGECSVSVTFAPTQLGTRSGQITMWTSATDQPTWTSLSGTGIQPTTYPLSVSKTGQGTVSSVDGHIYCGSACSYPYIVGTQVTLSAVPAPGYTVNGWTGCDNVNGSYCSVTMTSAKNVSATFHAAQVTLTSLTFKPSYVRGGRLSAGTLTLGGPAPLGGVTVALSSDHPEAAHPPSFVLVPGGQTSVGFAVNTFPVKSNITVMISAVAGTSQVSGTLTVGTTSLPPSIK